jgi:hypothetical protein
MELTMLYKDPSSGGGGCPSVYLAENGDFVVQGLDLDGATSNNLANVLPGEGAVRISAEIVLGAVEAYQNR